MRKRDDQLAALATMSPAQLRDAWPTNLGEPAPLLPPDLLRRTLACRLQEKRHGGLPAVVARELMRDAAGGAGKASIPPPVVIRPGTRLIREWQGRTIAVLATEDGFCWEERSYSSLTAIAREVTGARWSGPRFFGLTSRG